MAGIKLVDRAVRRAAGGGRPSTISRPSARRLVLRLPPGPGRVSCYLDGARVSGARGG